MALLLKSGIWLFVLSVVGFSLVAGGVCGPTTDLGTYVAEATMFGAPLGIVMCIAVGVWTLIKKKPEWDFQRTFQALQQHFLIEG
jgi:hypothetical protein